MEGEILILFFLASRLITALQLNLYCPLLLKVLYFRNKMALKNSLDDDESTSSSKISFRWDVGSCSTSSSVVSPLSLPTVSRIDHQMCVKNASSSAIALHSSNSPKTEGCSRGGQWITSDSDCKLSFRHDFSSVFCTFSISDIIFCLQLWC